MHRTACERRVRRGIGNASVVLHNEKHEEVVRWNLVNAWPSKYVGPDMKANANEVAIESIELTHEGVERA